MKVWQCDDSRPVPGLTPGELEPPELLPGEISIRVYAAGVTQPELEWYPTTHAKSGEPRSHAVPGHEFSGVVSSAAAGAPFARGDEVFGMNDWFADGATAEFCRSLPSMIAPKPVRLTHVEAASVPIGALTAWQGLFDRAALQSGETVLIHGGAGGVGVFAIQLARQRGAHVVTTASARNRDFLLELGAQQVVDYHTERFEDLCKGVDVVFDCVGGATLQRSWNVLRPGGRLVTIESSGATTQDDRTKNAFFIVEPNQGQLREIAGQLNSGQLRTVINRIVPFDQAASAYLPRTAHDLGPSSGRGKSVIAVV